MEVQPEEESSSSALGDPQQWINLGNPKGWKKRTLRTAAAVGGHKQPLHFLL